MEIPNCETDADGNPILSDPSNDSPVDFDWDPNDYFFDLEEECDKAKDDHTIVVPSSIQPIDGSSSFWKFMSARDIVPFVQGIDPNTSFRLKDGIAIIRLSDVPKLRLPRNPKESYPVLVYYNNNSIDALSEINSLL